MFSVCDAVYNFFNDANGNMFVQFQTKYNNIVKLTRDIETWAKEGDESGVNYRLCDLPKPLEELATIVNNMFNKFKELKKMRQFHPVLKPNDNKRGNIILSIDYRTAIITIGKNWLCFQFLVRRSNM